MVTTSPTHITIEVERPLTEDEMLDVKQAAKNIMSGNSFFYAADDDLGDEIRRFIVDHPILSNLEQVIEG